MRAGQQVKPPHPSKQYSQKENIHIVTARKNHLLVTRLNERQRNGYVKHKHTFPFSVRLP